MRAIELVLLCAVAISPGSAAADAYDEMIGDFQPAPRSPLPVSVMDSPTPRLGQRARERIDALHRDEKPEPEKPCAESTTPRTPAPSFGPTRERSRWHGPPTIQINNDVNVAGCRTGDTRPAAGAAPRTATWFLPGGPAYVEVVSASGHGSYAVPGGREMFEVMSWGSYVTAPGVPLPPPVKLPLKIVETAGRIGSAVYDAGTRWARRHAASLVDVAVRLPRNRVTVTCLQIDLCKQGRWSDGGVQVTEEVSEMDPLRVTQSDVMGAQLESAVRRLLQSQAIRILRKAEQDHEAHPCDGPVVPRAGASPGTSAPPTTPTTTASAAPPPAPARRNCRPPREALEAATSELEQRTSERDAVRQRLSHLETERGSRMAEAQQRLGTAERVLKVAQEAESNLTANSRGIPGRATSGYQEALRRVADRVDTASRAVDQARAAVESARTPGYEETALAQRVRSFDTQVTDLEARVRQRAEELRLCEEDH